ncbi:MAG: hypothetical protein KF842_06785 [Caulobacter sp.]|nr:hypothetical protein [Caulobacter sp.]
MKGGLGLQLRVALEGDFDKEVGLGLARTERALAAAVFDYTDQIVDDWRADIERSGLANGEALGRTVKSRHYRNKGLNPAGLAYSSFPVIQRAFESEGVIRSPIGKFLLIPNPDVWPGGRVQIPRGRYKGSKTTLFQAERAFGKLRLVYRRDGPSLLVADARESAGRSGGGVPGHDPQTIIVFFLVKQARSPRLLRGAEIRARAERESGARVSALFIKHFETDSRTGPGANDGAAE